MSKKTKQVWSLNPAEVSGGITSYSSGKTGQFERRLKTTSYTIFLTHEPTGLRVEGKILPGNYSKKEMRRKQKDLKQSLFKDLEYLVAKKQRIKGR